ncbi:MAG: hypothetical protein HRU20_03630 [Pseudomonadales bacterium]|nr:hypothetical protein [Pseudomonadales bacterium]
MPTSFFNLLSITLLCLLSACSAKTYQPQEYSLRDKLIRDFEVSGTISITAINMQENPRVIYANLLTFESSYQDIAHVMAQQLEKEIIENSTVDGDLDKQLYLQLDNFYIEPGNKTVTFHIDFTLLGERGFEKHFVFSSAGEELKQSGIEVAFDNSIALAVKRVLYNADTLQYLARKNLK